MEKTGNELVVITIPIYKPVLNHDEQDSLMQLFTILGHYPICFCTYAELDLSNYQKLLTGKPYNVIYFDQKYFMDINGYNLLMLSRVFYKRFLKYKYLLVYQLDAWVFNDMVKFWCNQNYDYIGAPWFKDYQGATGDSPFLGVGNGGFSLRKIKSHLRVLNSFSYVQPFSAVWAEFFEHPKTLKSLKQLLGNLTIRNNTYYKFNNFGKNEDVFWGIIAERNFKWFKVPDMLTAAKFSVEVNASKLYTLTGQLPFGGHALLRYDPDFFNEIKKL